MLKRLLYLLLWCYIFSFFYFSETNTKSWKWKIRFKSFVTFYYFVLLTCSFYKALFCTERVLKTIKKFNLVIFKFLTKLRTQQFKHLLSFENSIHRWQNKSPGGFSFSAMHWKWYHFKHFSQIMLRLFINFFRHWPHFQCGCLLFLWIRLSKFCKPDYDNIPLRYQCLHYCLKTSCL